MAKNREPENPVDYQSESDEEEEEVEATSEEVGSQDSDSEVEPRPVSKEISSSSKLKKAQPQSAVKRQKGTAPLTEEEEEDSDSESEPEPDETAAPKSNIGARKPRSKPNPSEPVATAKSNGKRSLENKVAEVGEAKKAKKKSGAETSGKKSGAETSEKKSEVEASGKKSSDDSKKSLFQRVWSEDDEIAVLEGMIEYTSKKKSDPVADLNAFHEFIKKNLHVDVTRTQLQDKIRRLKRKYENNKSKVKPGQDKTFTKPHEHRAYELSKIVWGNEAGKENGAEKGLASPKSNGTLARKASNRRAAIASGNMEAGQCSKSFGDEGVNSLLGKRPSSGAGWSIEERIVAVGSILFESGTGLEGENLWKKLKVEELEFHLKILELKKSQTKLVLDVLKSEEH